MRAEVNKARRLNYLTEIIKLFQIQIDFYMPIR